MKKYILTLATIAAFSSIPAVAIDSGFFAPRSRLASGNWVKIGVDQSGIYEISYSKLREMGFSDPSKVGVLGRGGRQMDIDFTDVNGNRLNPDDLSPIAVYHHDEKLYFYGQGTQFFTFNPYITLSTKGLYQRKSRNVYTDLGYYFLSDSPEARRDMETVDSSEALRYETTGMSYIAHEEDLEQNNTHTGNFFWGERFNFGEPSRREWNFEFPDAVVGEDAMMECFFYTELGTSGTLEWGVKDADKKYSSNIVNYNSTNFRAQEPTIHSTSIPATSGKVFIDYNSDDNTDGVANLDYWTLTYIRNIPTLRDINGNPVGQSQLGFPGIPEGEKFSINLDATPTATVFDVTNPLFPVAIPSKQKDGRTFATISATSNIPMTIVSDLSRPQLQIKGYSSGWQDVANQNLHSLGAEGASLLIITTEKLLPQAERLANLHRTRDGIRVAVATGEQIYNEFSAGVPDPMAYRTFAKMLYESPGEKLKNVLLLGPIYSDFRGMITGARQEAGLIAFQNTTTIIEKGAQNVNDFIGMMDDYRPDTRFERARVQVGVAVLPCYEPEEADAYIDKVEKYLDDDSFAYRLNRMMTVGGLEDRHTHDNQAVNLGAYLNPNNFNHLMYTTLAIDAYGAEEAGKKFIGAFSEGYNLITYFGHGATTMLGKNMDFFCKADIPKLHNTHYPFMVFAGCVLSNTDRGVRGLAEDMVLGHDAGLIGAILATRDTWSGENMDMVKIIFNRMFKDGNSIAAPQLTTPITIGEVFARAKDQSEYSNELAYLLVCDPAITVPVAMRTMKAESELSEIYVGRTFTLRGRITDFSGNTDTAFNGELVARLCYPEITLISDDLETDEKSDGNILKVPYADRQATACAVTVKNGVFDLRMNVPKSMGANIGENAILYLSAFDKGRRLGGAARVTPLISTSTSSGVDKGDATPPAIDRLEYNPEEETLLVSVSDNAGLDLSYNGHPETFRLAIDGKSTRDGWEALTRFIPDAIGFTKEISVGYLSAGVHTARLEVTDIDGNNSVKEISFEIGRKASLSLSLQGTAAREEAIFEIEGSASSPIRLVITTADGQEVTTLSTSGDSARWNLKGNNDNRVAPGLYKAYLRSADGRAWSEAIDLPVVAYTGK